MHPAAHVLISTSQNLLEQYTWRDWYLDHRDIVDTPNPHLDTEEGARIHVDHCIEALRISIMCQGDTTPGGGPRGRDGCGVGL